MADKTQPDEIFAGRSIRFWAQFTEAELLSDWGFNEAQIPLLNKQLAAADLKLREKTKLEEQAEARGESVEEESVKEEEPAKKPARKK